MAEIKKFFGDPEVHDGLLEVIRRLSTPAPEDEKVRMLLSALRPLAELPDLFDRTCQFNIEWIGKDFKEKLSEVPLKLDSEFLDYLLVNVFRFVAEYDLSSGDRMNLKFENFVRYVRNHIEEFNKDAIEQIRFAQHDMPIGILKAMLNSDEMKNFRNLPGFMGEIEVKFADWNSALKRSEAEVQKLKDALDSYENGFGFVGLVQGFDELSKRVAEDLKWARRWLRVFGVLLVVPLVAEVTILVTLATQSTGVSVPYLTGISLSMFSLTIILVYFFRISLRSSDAAKIQLSQIELRKTLCRFVQSYRDFAVEQKNKDPQFLSKFENIIFSSIVSNDERLPSTYDGLEQLSAMIKSIRGT